MFQFNEHVEMNKFCVVWHASLYDYSGTVPGFSSVLVQLQNNEQQIMHFRLVKIMIVHMFTFKSFNKSNSCCMPCVK